MYQTLQNLIKDSQEILSNSGIKTQDMKHF